MNHFLNSTTEQLANFGAWAGIIGGSLLVLLLAQEVFVKVATRAPQTSRKAAAEDALRHIFIDAPRSLHRARLRRVRAYEAQHNGERAEAMLRHPSNARPALRLIPGEGRRDLFLSDHDQPPTAA